MTTIKIRYNTENTTDLFWRVLIEGEEKLCSKVLIGCPCFTSKDQLPDGRVKFHISCNPAKVEYLDKEKTFVLS